MVLDLDDPVQLSQRIFRAIELDFAESNSRAVTGVVVDVDFEGYFRNRIGT